MTGRTLRSGIMRAGRPVVAGVSLLALLSPADPLPRTLVDAKATANAGETSVRRAVDGGHPLFLAPPPTRTEPEPKPPPGELNQAAALPAFGIPATVLAAYRRAAERVAQATPGCRLAWPVLAGIGKVESNHARGGDVTSDGELIDPIYGPALDGSAGTAAITDSRGGWARAAGPMQFIPSTWAVWGADGNGDGKADVQNVFDSALAAAQYLCADGRDVATGPGLRDAILSYNYSQQYLDTVLAWIRAYQNGGGPVPDEPYEPGTFEVASAAPAPAPAPSSRPAPGATPPPPPPSRRQPAPPPSNGTPPPSNGAPPPSGGAQPPPPSLPLLPPLDALLPPASNAQQHPAAPALVPCPRP